MNHSVVPNRVWHGNRRTANVQSSVAELQIPTVRYGTRVAGRQKYILKV